MKDLYIATYILLAIRFIRAIRRKLSLCEPENAEYVIVVHDDTGIISVPIVILRNKSKAKLALALAYIQGKGFLRYEPSGSDEFPDIEPGKIVRFDLLGNNYARFEDVKGIYSDWYARELTELIHQAEERYCN
jgi:hypothetical protein